MSENLSCTQNTDATRFEAHFEGALASLLEYRFNDNVYDLFHAETPAAYSGRGFASCLAEFTLKAIREQGSSVRPSCPFIRGYLNKHPEYQDLIAN